MECKFYIDEHNTLVVIYYDYVFKYIQGAWHRAFPVTVALDSYLDNLKPISEKYLILRNIDIFY